MRNLRLTAFQTAIKERALTRRGAEIGQSALDARSAATKTLWWRYAALFGLVARPLDRLDDVLATEFLTPIELIKVFAAFGHVDLHAGVIRQSSQPTADGSDFDLAIPPRASQPGSRCQVPVQLEHQIRLRSKRRFTSD